MRPSFFAAERAAWSLLRALPRREKSWETLDGRGNPGEDVASLLYRFSEVPGKGARRAHAPPESAGGVSCDRAGRVLPLPAREGRIPPHDLWARPANPLPTRSEKRPLCVTKFGKNMDPSQSFHVCSQLPAEKAKGSLPEQTNMKRQLCNSVL
ncbi:hypothetical protein AB1E18_004763 [Capra hircus]